ncbi:MAG TPA: nitroreductase family deazaflavin-dependent oxidoreductase [Thermoleophilaceae bacterium]|nr:nitroreductase family deazaflavin-dependent oxidoreductase [Thermoleophilaceae bacterium]
MAIGDRSYSRFSMAIPAGALRAIGRLNVPVYRATGGRVGGRVGKAPVLLLTTTGRKSGEPRTAPVLYLSDGGRLVVIGSNAGNPRTPAWALNLAANPDAEIEIGRKRQTVRARIAQGSERSELWRKVNDLYAGFADYEERTSRDISVFVLEPGSASPVARR